MKSQAYALDKVKFSMTAGVIDQVETWALLSPFVAVYFGSDGAKPASGIASLWHLAIDLCQRWSHLAPAFLNIGTGEIATSLFFVSLLSLTGMITSIPSSLYKTFVLEEKHGFNKQTLGLWITDYIKTTILSAVFGLPLIAAFLWTVRWAGEAFVQYVMMLVYAHFLCSSLYFSNPPSIHKIIIIIFVLKDGSSLVHVSVALSDLVLVFSLFSLIRFLAPFRCWISVSDCAIVQQVPTLERVPGV
jgi:hypothetical protein